MILAIDIGNTNIVIGCIDGDNCLFVERLSTVRTKTELEYAIDIKSVLDIYHIKSSELEGGIISSVVPQITVVAKLAVEKILKREALIVGAGIKTGLNIRIDNPAQLGSDLVVDSVAALAEYPAPLLIFDMGTANTVCVIDKNKKLCRRYDISGHRRLAGLPDRTCVSVGRHQSGGPGEYHWKEYRRLYEKRGNLQFRGRH